MPVVEDVEEGEAGGLGNGGPGGGVEEVPCGPDVRVWYVERLVEVFEGIDCVTVELVKVSRSQP